MTEEEFVKTFGGQDRSSGGEIAERVRAALPKCDGCGHHFLGDHLCTADHEAHCDIRTSRDGWDADCSCKRGRP